MCAGNLSEVSVRASVYIADGDNVRAGGEGLKYDGCSGRAGGEGKGVSGVL
jgi:hypothetical protein